MLRSNVVCCIVIQRIFLLPLTSNAIVRILEREEDKKGSSSRRSESGQQDLVENVSTQASRRETRDPQLLVPPYNTGQRSQHVALR